MRLSETLLLRVDPRKINKTQKLRFDFWVSSYYKTNHLHSPRIIIINFPFRPEADEILLHQFN